MHINGGKHVLKHGGHEFDLHAIGAKVVENEKWMVTELLLVHTMLLQRRDNIFGKRILGRSQEEMLLKVLEDMKTHHMPPLGGKEVNHALVFILNIYLEHPEIKHGAFGESGKPLKTQKHCCWMVFQKSITIIFCLPASEPTMLMVL